MVSYGIVQCLQAHTCRAEGRSAFSAVVSDTRLGGGGAPSAAAPVVRVAISSRSSVCAHSNRFVLTAQLAVVRAPNCREGRLTLFSRCRGSRTSR